MFERCLYFNLNTLTREVNRLWEDAFRKVGLSPSHAYLMRAVFNTPGITQKNLADELKLSPSTVTRFIDTLAARGLLERRNTGEDARESAIYPGKESKTIKNELEHIARGLSKQVRAIINEADVGDLVVRLREAKAALQQAKNHAKP